MNSRERLNKVLSLGVSDRVPISTYELAGYNSRAFENKEPSYKRLMDVIREKTDCVCMWNPSSNAVFLDSSYDVEIVEKTQRTGTCEVTRRTVRTPKGELTSTLRREDNVHTVWGVERWCKNKEDVDRALSVPYVPLKYDASDFARIKEEVGDRGIIMPSLADPLLIAAETMEFGSFTVWAMTETEHFARTIDIMHERNMENLRRMLDVNVADLYRICGPEYATPPYLPPSFFGRFVTPYVSQMVELTHSKGAKARLHCHGRIGKVLDMIAGTGADAIDPCEGPPDGDITLSEVKKRAGGKMCIFGNVQLKALEHASKQEVKEIVRECMDAAKEGGGYCVMPTAAPINVPLSSKTEENYIAFIETALELGRY